MAQWLSADFSLDRSGVQFPSVSGVWPDGNLSGESGNSCNSSFANTTKGEIKTMELQRDSSREQRLEGFPTSG